MENAYWEMLIGAHCLIPIDLLFLLNLNRYWSTRYLWKLFTLFCRNRSLICSKDLIPSDSKYQTGLSDGGLQSFVKLLHSSSFPQSTLLKSWHAILHLFRMISLHQFMLYTITLGNNHHLKQQHLYLPNTNMTSSNNFFDITLILN